MSTPTGCVTPPNAACAPTRTPLAPSLGSEERGAVAQKDLSLREAVRITQALPLPMEVVTSCLLDREQDQTFRKALEHGLATIAPAMRRGALGGVTGHVAESVVAVLLEQLGYFVVWQFVGPGAHGVDLLELSPDTNRLLAVEVKGTLRPRRWPSLSKGELNQFTPGWLDKRDNPGMFEWNIESDDVYGGIFLINFADRLWKAVLTNEFGVFHPISSPDDLQDLSWLDQL